MEDYKDFALGKHVLEFCNHPLDMTKPGDDEPYDSINGGYLGIHHPANITVDLESQCEVKQISIKFFDCEDSLCIQTKDTAIKHSYAFRLLCSADGHSWSVLYDSSVQSDDKKYVKGWRYAVLEEPLKMRHFRIHALHNPSSSGFHVVRLRLLDRVCADLQRGEELVLSKKHDVEVGDSTPLSTQLYNLLGRISSRLSSETKSKPKYSELSNHIFEKALEFEAIDGRIDQIRKIVTPHMEKIFESKERKEALSQALEALVTILLIVAAAFIR